jgi:hypothetical protein
MSPHIYRLLMHQKFVRLRRAEYERRSLLA